MSIPVKISYPTYSIKLYSDGRDVKFRPFNHSEEQSLLTAREGDDLREQAEAMRSLVEGCTFEKVDIGTLPMFDIEYLFLRMRIQAVDPTVTVGLRCPGNSQENPCEHVSFHTIPLDEVTVCTIDEEGGAVEFDYRTHGPDHKGAYKVMIDDDVGLLLKYPNVEVAQHNDEYIREILTNASNVETEMGQNAILSNMYRRLAYELTDAIFSSDTFTTKSEFTFEEFCEFYDSFLPEHKLKIREFVQKIPHLRYEYAFECEECGKTDTVVYKGLQDFFG